MSNEYYQSVTLPFDLFTAPWVFTKVFDAVLALLDDHNNHVVVYLDDLLVKGPVLPFPDSQHATDSAASAEHHLDPQPEKVFAGPISQI